MSENEITLKSISALLQLKVKFLIPSYQRGYRWTKQQVEDLLNDIWEFGEKKTKDEIYCLQPVIIKKWKEEWEVIDGQQRLVTIYLVLKHLESLIDGETKNFSIRFETRPSSEVYLETIEEKRKDDNIDYFHIYHANETIINWFNNKAKIGFQNARIRFLNPFLESTKVIWYEIRELNVNATEIFTRINMGKIPLTPAELIKALFLSEDKFKTEEGITPETIVLKQGEIAQEWDKFEYALQNEEFWYFLNKEENNLATRIEFLFDLITIKKINSDELHSFHTFQKNLDNSNIKEEWQKVKSLFQTLEGWFNDREFYHYIGFIVSVGIRNIEDLLALSEKPKNIFKNELISIISENIKLEKVVAEIDGNGDEALKYGPDNFEITKMLLLFNIASMLNFKDSNARFPFDLYKKSKTRNGGDSLEHIHAQNSADFNKVEDYQKYLTTIINQFKFYNEIKVQDVEILLSKYHTDNDIAANIEEFRNIEKIIGETFGDPDLHSISNLALLGLKENIKLQNVPFPDKRMKIIRMENEGHFIPLCTLNVFMKYYSRENGVSKMYKWGNEDRESYLKNIEQTLSNFLSGQEYD